MYYPVRLLYNNCCLSWTRSPLSKTVWGYKCDHLHYHLDSSCEFIKWTKLDTNFSHGKSRPWFSNHSSVSGVSFWEEIRGSEELPSVAEWEVYPVSHFTDCLTLIRDTKTLLDYLRWLRWRLASFFSYILAWRQVEGVIHWPAPPTYVTSGLAWTPCQSTSKLAPNIGIRK